MASAPPNTSSVSTGPASARGRWLPLVVLVAGLLVFALLALASLLIYDDAEQDLLEERTDEASSVLTVSVTNIRTPLDAAATLARVTDGNPEYFVMSFEDQVGEGRPFTSAALFRMGSQEPIAMLGEPLELGVEGSTSVQQTMETAASEPFVVVDLLAGERRLGYAVVDDAEQPAYLVYAERLLNPDPNERQRTDEPFSEMDYAIYLNNESPETLLGSSLRELPIEGRRATAVSQFGDQELLLVMTPIGHLSSWLFVNLWWIVAVMGVILATVAAWLTRRLHVRREQALELAHDNARLYDEQRHIAETLQLSLLPQELAPPPGGAIAARYWPAGEASLIGGDFYDAFRVDDQRWGFAIGDVCGKGIDAAGITGLVRHTLRAAARNSTSATEVLVDVHNALREHRPSTFCTVCFLYMSVTPDGTQRLSLSLGGHPPPLLRRADGSVFEIGVPGTLLGLFEPVLSEHTFDVAPDDTLVLYTDGLTDAPQAQAVPIQELIDLLVVEGAEPVERLADSIRPLKRRRRPRGSADDTAIVVVRFGAPEVGERQLVPTDSSEVQSAGV